MGEWLDGWQASKRLRAAHKLLPTHLVRPADEVEVVLLQEAGHHVLAEGEGHAAVVLAPPHNVLVGVRPEQVAEEARVFWVVVVGVGMGRWGQTDLGLVGIVCVWGGGDTVIYRSSQTDRRQRDDALTHVQTHNRHTHMISSYPLQKTRNKDKKNERTGHVGGAGDVL